LSENTSTSSTSDLDSLMHHHQW